MHFKFIGLETLFTTLVPEFWTYFYHGSTNQDEGVIKSRLRAFHTKRWLEEWIGTLVILSGATWEQELSDSLAHIVDCAKRVYAMYDKIQSVGSRAECVIPGVKIGNPERSVRRAIKARPPQSGGKSCGGRKRGGRPPNGKSINPEKQIRKSSRQLKT
jgi:hypothetical protein